MFDFDKYRHSCAALLDFMKKGRGGIYIGGYNILGANVFGQQVVIDSRHTYSLKLLYSPLAIETSILALLIQLVKPGMICLDVGAGCGFYSLLIASISGSAGKVYSFEPIPECLTLLKENIEINTIESVSYVDKPVLDQIKTVTQKYFNGNYHFFFFENFPQQEKIVKKESISLDQYFADKESSIDFVNINFEKDLPAALKGMNEIIKFNPTIKILCRFNKTKIANQGYNPELFLKEIEETQLRMLLLPNLTLIEAEELLEYSVTKHILLTKS